MDDSEKPFACPAPDCNMSFTNEDHLVVHKKKHDMVLNLGANGKNTFVADQTPTPTRFIRNCEEVGLFQDLQNVNPFEETFRRAVEAGKTGSLSENEVSGSDDTLHTPHIFLNIADVPTTTSTLTLSNDKTDENISAIEIRGNAIEERDSSLVTRQTSSKSVEIIIESNEEIETRSGSVVVQRTETSLTPKKISSAQPTSNLQINGQEVQLLLKTADGKLMQLSAMPFGENRNENFRENISKSETIVVENNEPTFRCIAEGAIDVRKEANVSSSSRMTLAKTRLKQALTKNVATSVVPTTNRSTKISEKTIIANANERSSGNTDQRKKQEVQARNRASSMRARAKRKAWIQQLQRTANNANEKNAALQSEVKALRSEVTKLRALLLAHESCSVTKAIRRESFVTSESKTSFVDSTIARNIRTTPTNVIQARKRAGNSVEQPIAPKIFKSSSLTSKPHAILPKSDVGRTIPVVKDASGLKIVEVRAIVNDSEPSKRIVIVPNATRRYEFVRSSSRSIIHVNPTNFQQIENAASKCTGT